MTTGLTFNTLRGANTARLPLFKNCHGAPAHTKGDGSDWSPAMWFVALLGELGEVAECRVQYEVGEIDWDTYKARVTAEIADVQTYLDIFARRALDKIEGGEQPADWAQQLMQITMELGRYANVAKKRVRGDYNDHEFNLHRHGLLHSVADGANNLSDDTANGLGYLKGVVMAHPTGVDLGQATVDKFNIVSKRVGCGVHIQSTGESYMRPVGTVGPEEC